MPHEIQTEIEMDAPADRVWSVLTDFAAYPSWNPFVTRIEGDLAKGARLLVHVQPPGGSGMTFRPRLTDVQKGKSLAWLGRLGIRGLFDGAHRFEITSLGDGRCRFVHAEHFAGLLVPLLRKSLDGPTRQGFIAMNEAMKARAEENG